MATSAHKNKIVRIHFSNGDVMMFGDSYKPWDMQVSEYLQRKLYSDASFLNDLTITDVTMSESPWISWGGLKWTPEEEFQHQLNREGCQENEPDNPKPRQYSDMFFYRDSSITKKANKIFNMFQSK